MYLIRKSRMGFDFSAPKHEEQRTVHGGGRHMQNGAVVQVAEHQRRTQVVTRDIGSVFLHVYQSQAGQN